MYSFLVNNKCVILLLLLLLENRSMAATQLARDREVFLVSRKYLYILKMPPTNRSQKCT